MNRMPPELDKIVDVVLAYRPPTKKKKLAAKKKSVEKKNGSPKKRIDEQ